ncbi:HK97 gp10 family phage protein [Prauserella endophytica]|uniref:HK97 gp10 family phage protein n=1 Tax=Prauserella endophytica TaxID=1592324 RepID=A0ABY2RSU8_9PSEU|nr:HK97 gp10 family phage protein [Prauserella endophytica]
MANRDEINRLVGDLSKLPREFRREARKNIRRAAQPIAADARRRASWSKRIPKAIKLGTRLSKKVQGVSIRVDSKIAPHARPYEGIGTRGDSFRHPVFGTGDRRGAHSQDKWVSQKKRPFLGPAVESKGDSIRDAVDESVRDAARKAGWTR